MTEPDRERALEAAARTDFLTFLRFAFATVSPGDRFLGNWHLEAIAWQLQRIEEGETTRLMVTVPPRSLKSIAMSVAWVAWRLGHDPGLRIVCVSYSADLAAQHARDCRAVMEAPWYRRLFPGTVIARGGDMDFRTTRRGGRLATSVGGTLTGRGGDIIVIDDPIKPEDAMSETAREHAWSWYCTTLSTRLNDKKSGVILLVMQRLHEDDLAGHLIGAGGWEHLCLPAIAETDEVIPLGRRRVHERRAGDVLHPERENRERLEEQKRIMSSLAFSAQYQQAPIPMDGNLVKRDWLRFHDGVPERRSGDLIVQSWDTATRAGVQNDYSVCITALVRRSRVFVLDVCRARLDFPDLVRRVKALARAHHADVLLIEDAASGAQLIQTLQAEEPDGVPSPIAIKPQTDKVTRLAGQTAKIEAGGLFLPRDASWLSSFEHELLGFPYARHDDQVDALSQLLAWERRHREPTLLAVASSHEPGWTGRFSAC